MTKTNKILIAVLIILLICGGILWLDSTQEESSGSLQKVETTSPALEFQTNSVNLVINYGEGGIIEFTRQGVGNDGVSVLDLLLEFTQAQGINVVKKDSDFGVMIESIGDKKNGDDGKYWMFYINGELSPVGVSEAKVKPGDTVEFKFEESSF
ncbi:MAG: DUF4430 domain-containing protein [Candidatus Pacebacteria bacterium]|nr:DUF4430 domain-containing protein [Candidatus Paceibacterota bacterium]